LSRLRCVLYALTLAPRGDDDPHETGVIRIVARGLGLRGTWISPPPHLTGRCGRVAESSPSRGIVSSYASTLLSIGNARVARTDSSCHTAKQRHACSRTEASEERLPRPTYTSGAHPPRDAGDSCCHLVRDERPAVQLQAIGSATLDIRQTPRRTGGAWRPRNAPPPSCRTPGPEPCAGPPQDR